MIYNEFHDNQRIFLFLTNKLLTLDNIHPYMLFRFCIEQDLITYLLISININLEKIQNNQFKNSINAKYIDMFPSAQYSLSKSLIEEDWINAHCDMATD